MFDTAMQASNRCIGVAFQSRYAKKNHAAGFFQSRAGRSKLA
jgi:hypothetical protein